MKQTALTDIHRSLGARIVPFAGYEMPVVYSGINEEHLTVRESVGMFDVSHMGEFIIRGEQARKLLQRVTTNDVHKLSPWKAQYSCMTNVKGGIVDDLLVYMISEEEYMLVVNASNIEKDWNWISSQNTMGAEMENISDKITLLAVQGPGAADTLASLTSLDLKNLKYYTFCKGDFNGADGAVISATGYTGSGGFEIYLDNRHALNAWHAIMESGKKFNIKPIGLGARDTLRLEMGFCLYGNDITDETSPLEAGLGWITKLKAEDNDFIARDILLRQKEEGIQRKLIGLEMIERGIPRQHYGIKDQDGNTIGEVTSGTQSPSLNRAIGMGYVNISHSEPETEVYIDIRNKQVSAKIVRPPFYKAK